MSEIMLPLCCLAFVVGLIIATLRRGYARDRKMITTVPVQGYCCYFEGSNKNPSITIFDVNREEAEQIARMQLHELVDVQKHFPNRRLIVEEIRGNK